MGDSMAMNVEVPVFTETSLGTRIAVAIAPDITAGDFKRELKRAHLNCFPELGEIRIVGLMVKRKSCFYHLPESLPIKYAFQGLKGAWFLHMEACHLSGSDKTGLSECMETEISNPISSGCNIADLVKSEGCTTHANKSHKRCKGKKGRTIRHLCFKAVLQEILRNILVHKKKRKKRKKAKKDHLLTCTVNGLQKGWLSGNEGVSVEEKFDFFASRTEGEQIEEWNSSPKLDSICEPLSEAVSVTGIIEKYFSDCRQVVLGSDVTSIAIQNQFDEQLNTRTDGNCTSLQVGAMQQFKPQTPPRRVLFHSPTSPSSGTLRGKFKSSEVGARLLVASKSLGISASKQNPATLCRYQNGKSLMPKSSSVCRSIVFDISDTDA